LEKRIYQSSQSYNAFSIVKEIFIGYKNSFYLAKQLAMRDISAQYRQSILGIFWAFAPVIMNASVWIFLQGTGTVKLSDTNIPYPVYVIIGTTLWTLLGECLLMTITSVNSNKSIITKINFPKEALITLGFIKVSFNLLMKLVLIICLMFFFSTHLSVSFLWFIPILFFCVLFCVGIGILLTPLAVLYQDITRVIPIAMQILMYITPVVYNIPKNGIMKTFMFMNPFTYIIVDLRNSLTGGVIEYPYFFVGLAVCSIMIYLLASIVYKVSMPIITERMSS
jgi:lipopolysaccharide transport system permease protein